MKPILRAAVVAALAVALPACSDDKPTPETARQALERLAPSLEGEAPEPAPAIASYRLTFDRINAVSTADAAGELKPKRLVRTVHRPLSSKVDGEIQRRLGFEQDSPSGIERATFLRPLADDARPDVYPAGANRDAGRNRRAAGRLCRVFLFDDDEYCVDGSGLVLASRVNGVVEVARRVEVLQDVTSVEEIVASLAEGVADQARGSVRPVDPSTSPPGRTDWSLPAPPAGFTFVGRYTVVPLTSDVLDQGSQGVIAGLTDVYMRGVDIVVVDRGGKLNLTDATDESLGSLGDESSTDLGQIGAGRVGIGGIGPFGYREVRGVPEKGRYVVVAGTLPAEQLVEIARSLRPSPGNELRYLDKIR